MACLGPRLPWSALVQSGLGSQTHSHPPDPERYVGDLLSGLLVITFVARSF